MTWKRFPHSAGPLWGEFAALLWRHNVHDGVSNHQPHECLLNRPYRRRSKKTSKLRVTGLCAGIHRGPVNSPHKCPITRKMLPFDDVIRGHGWIPLTKGQWPLVITGFPSDNGESVSLSWRHRVINYLRSCWMRNTPGSPIGEVLNDSILKVVSCSQSVTNRQHIATPNELKKAFINKHC